MNRREFIFSGAAAYTGASLSPANLSEPKKPNILFFLIDDLGWGDLGCYGDPFHETPAIDALAREGMRFDQAYAAAPVCSPSRAAILTGQAPARIHLTQWLPGSIYPNKKLLEAPTPAHLSRDLPTLAELLRSAGYYTGAIGKWHLGGEGYLPEDFGFEVNIAGDETGHPPSYFGPFAFHNLTGSTVRDYLTEVLTTKAEQFLDSVPKGQPFFLYMAEYAVHLPLEARQALVDKYKLKNGGVAGPDPIYAAMVESVDIALGALRQTLRRRNMDQDTVIVLTSDNGGVGFQYRDLHRIADNGRLRAGKGFLFEGGLRVPLIVHWPGRVAAGSTCHVPVSGVDFLPTILDVSNLGHGRQTQDGLSLMPLLRGTGGVDREALYWHYPHYSDQGGTPSGAIRVGQWKLIEFFEDMHVELYNLELDPGEQYDFASSFSDKAEELRRKLHAWRREVGAVMPRLNPNYSGMAEESRLGPPGCSWDRAAGCRED